MEPTAEERQMAMIAHIGGAVLALFTGLGFIVPLVLYLTKKDQSKFIGFHALQSLILHGVLWAVGIVLGIITAVSCGIGALVTVPIGLIAGIGALVLMIMAGIKANEGQWYMLPVAGDYARKSIGV